MRTHRPNVLGIGCEPLDRRRILRTAAKFLSALPLIGFLNGTTIMVRM